MKAKRTKLTGISRSTLEPAMTKTTDKPFLFWFVVPWMVFFAAAGLWFAWSSGDSHTHEKSAILDALQSESRAWAQHDAELVASIGEAIKIIRIAESHADLTIHPDVASLRELLDAPIPPPPQGLTLLSRYREQNGLTDDIPQSIWDGLIEDNRDRTLEELNKEIDQLRALNEEITQRTRAIARRTSSVEKATHLSGR